MTRRRFTTQAVIVIVLAVLVSWPEFGTVRAASVWVNPPAAGIEVASDLLDSALAEDTQAIGVLGAGRGLGAIAGATTGQSAAARGGGRFIASSAVRAIGAEVNGIVGLARTFSNAPIPFARLVLRNIVTGRIIATVTADENGAYQFIDIDASAYIVELLAADGSVLAASEAVALALNEVEQTTVRLGARASRLLGATTGGDDFTDDEAAFSETLPEVTEAAAQQDITATEPGTRDEESPGSILG